MLLIGCDSRSVSEIRLLLVSVSVNAGAFWFTCGAFADAGSHLEAMNEVKINIATTSKQNVVTMDATIFEPGPRPRAKPRRRPMNKRINAKTNNGILTHGKSRVVSQFAKMKG